MSDLFSIKKEIVNLRQKILHKEVEYIERGYADESSQMEWIGKKLDSILRKFDTVSCDSALEQEKSFVHDRPEPDTKPPSSR